VPMPAAVVPMPAIMTLLTDFALDHDGAA
jgi:hypothetical protein